MSELFKIGADRFLVQWPVIFRALLYFLAGFLPAFTAEVSDDLKKGQWPTGPNFTLGLLLGLCAGVVILRAFYDSFSQSHNQKIDDKKKEETAFFGRPAP